MEEGDREEGHAESGAVLTAIAETQIEHGKILQAILSLLTAVASTDGDDLGKLLEVLVARIGEQTEQLRYISLAIAALGRDLPIDLAAAIDSALDVTHRPNGNGNGSTGS